MTKISRNSVFVFIAVIFLLNAANVPLFIHLAEHKTDSGHHSEKCPFCQQVAVNKTKALAANITVILELPQIIYTEVYVCEAFVKSSEFIIPYLRAPPVVS